MTDIAVWGLGKMGLPLSAVLANSGFSVTGIDIDIERVKAVNNGDNPFPEEPGLDNLLSSVKGLKATTEPVEADIHIIIIPILLKGEQADFSLLIDVLQKISTVLRKGDIVILESTAPPGTCDTIVTPVLEKTGLTAGKDFGVAHCPERTMAGSAIADITEKYPKIVGASDAQTLKTIVELYSTINTKGVTVMEDTKTAEAVKVFEGVYRDVNIALANELALYCERKGIDITSVIDAANSQPFCHLHKPGAGVGGHCIPVYPYFIMDDKTHLIRTARKINNSMPFHIVELAERKMNIHDIPLRNATILLLGIAFRGGVKEERFSPFFTVRDELLEKGINVCAYDPLYTEEEIERYGVTYKNDFSGVDVLILLTDHVQFRWLDWNLIYRSGVRIVIDGRNMLNDQALKEKGFDYTGIGKGVKVRP